MHTNALIDEKSPYLRQHAHNPVQWLPWGPATFEKARAENKPIFLSIGYSTCHWCHVMAHESFEDERTAEVLNRDFISVKVDREERPDLDRVYMLFVQASTGSGGWPMSVWLTPDLKPFFGGTYFPPDSRYGRPGFRELLGHLAHAWKEDRAKIQDSSVNVTEQLRSIASETKAPSDPDAQLFRSAYPHFERSFDNRWGGFGSAPKFPRPAVLLYLFRYYAAEKSEKALSMATETLKAMAAGGMHDHLGGGFHRYSVDDRWFVPHFEKMLYDQAQLVVAYLEAFQITGDSYFADLAHDILRYVLRDLTGQEGAFFSAEDADSPDPENPQHHGEGAFYIWRKSEIERVLGSAAERFCHHYGVQAEGNVEHDPQGEFVGRNILFERYPGDGARNSDEILARSKEKLLSVRSQRPRPHLDRKTLSAWNGLMISAFAKASLVLRHSEYLAAARRAASFILERMFDAQSGQLLRRYCDGEAAITGFADDYAFFTQALVELFEVTGDPDYLQTAVDLAIRGLSRFEDREGGGFYSTGENAPDVLLRMKDEYDGAEPSANSVAADVLLRLWHLTGRDEFRTSAERTLRFFTPRLRAQPTVAPQMLAAVGRLLNSPEQVVVRCLEPDEHAEELRRSRTSGFSPYLTSLLVDDQGAAALQGSAPFLSSLERRGRATVYRCCDFTCELPEVLD